MDVKASSNYHDFSGLASLRQEADSTPSEAIEPVAKQFEALFLQMMLKSMRAGVPDGGLFSESSVDMYEEMLDSQLSVTLSDQGGIGMAESIVDQLEGSSGASTQDLSGEGLALRSRLQQLGGVERSLQEYSLSADSLTGK
ncbi:Peptidoglycan hydrolase FlgJ [Zhongshania aliphaticivorans]|uniref:Peptidoglycan hydrolase FlgJ n=1 Tax=Zhongshania aliphaticivorans TaxID=1470434 RepID=A0A5S9NK30_9GAMM|nr:rod-binding protein [Zhongshania aliphaticivorans]CAA0091019.1 Peptidoglycan hydrolase FlgJ [Zhongshania aliphaticivorans]CAA0098510.1 Peptidoglycan hydrolase FlgJ [Zhongshania aliphaticivorans]